MYNTVIKKIFLNLFLKDTIKHKLKQVYNIATTETTNKQPNKQQFEEFLQTNRHLDRKSTCEMIPQTNDNNMLNMDYKVSIFSIDPQFDNFLNLDFSLYPFLSTNYLIE